MELSNTAQMLITAMENFDIAALNDLFSDDFCAMGPTKNYNKQEALALLQAYATAFPDMDFNFHDAKEKDGMLTIKMQETGTHSGFLDLNPVGIPLTFPATNGSFSLPEARMEFTLREEKITSMKEYNPEGGGMAGILSQLQIMPAS